MVLEGGLYLTAVEIAQMRHVPDLVFLNCCHLAKMDPEAKETNPVAYNKLAASLSRELIEMGVRAVVAAGWVVDDDAANEFAKAFYTAMLDGAGRSAGAVADAEATVHALNLQDLDRLAQQQPALALQLYRNIAVHLSQRFRSTADAWHASTR